MEGLSSDPLQAQQPFSHSGLLVGAAAALLLVVCLRTQRGTAGKTGREVHCKVHENVHESASMLDHEADDEEKAEEVAREAAARRSPCEAAAAPRASSSCYTSNVRLDHGLD
jgi:hypothetical protein